MRTAIGLAVHPRPNTYIDIDQLAAGTNSNELAAYAAAQRRRLHMQSVLLYIVIAMTIVSFGYSVYYVMTVAVH